jgi:hypothetical protein
MSALDITALRALLDKGEHDRVTVHLSDRLER